MKEGPSRRLSVSLSFFRKVRGRVAKVALGFAGYLKSLPLATESELFRTGCVADPVADLPFIRAIAGVGSP